jgi:viroplasmin and RNaseH domain-containing protein
MKNRNTGIIRLTQEINNQITYVTNEQNEFLEFVTIEDAKSFLRNQIVDKEAIYSVVRVMGSIKVSPQVRTQIEFRNVA